MNTPSNKFLKKCLADQQERVDQALTTVLELRKKINSGQKQLDYLLDIDRESANFVASMTNEQKGEYLQLLKANILSQQIWLTYSRKRYKTILTTLNNEKQCLRQMQTILQKTPQHKAIRTIGLKPSTAKLSHRVNS